MGRILSIDYGLKRTGLAVTDESQRFAFGLNTVKTSDLIAYLESYLSQHEVDGFVVGLPKKMDNTPSEITGHIEGFVRRLTQKYPDKEIYRIDERFTSSMATQSIIDSGIKKKGRADKALVDMVSATIILQSWIEKNEHHSKL